MFRFLLVAVAIALSSTLTAQNSFKAGYIIDLAGQRSEVDIYDKDWVSNPEYFRYRIPGGDLQQGDQRSVREFGYLDGSLRYRLFTVDIDQSGTRLKHMSAEPTPEYQPMTVYLEWLVDGPTDLFLWKEGDMERYFLRTDDELPNQLVSRRYLKEGRVVDNTNQFRAALLRQLDCGVARGDVLGVAYERRPLTRIVEQHNDCRLQLGDDQTFRELGPEIDRLSLALRLGTSRYTGDYYQKVFGRRITEPLGTRLAPRIGIEIQTLLPFANHRWALYGEAYYHRLLAGNENPETASIDYRSISIAMGARRYIFLSQRTALLLGFSPVLQIPIKSTVTYPIQGGAVERSYYSFHNTYYQLSAGVSIDSRYQLEVQFATPQNMVGGNVISYYTYFWMTSLIASYRFG